MFETIMDWIGVFLLLIGVAFMVLGAVAIIRMPDTFMRIQTTSKASTMGIGFVLLAAMIQFASLSAIARCLSLLVVAALTVPIGAHALGLATYRARLPMWKGTVVEEIDHEPRQ